MGVGALFKGKCGNGKDKGKDKNLRQMLYRGVPKACFVGACNVCGKVGRNKDQCWFKGFKDVGKGKETKGTGKKGGKSTPQLQGTWSHCCRWGRKKGRLPFCRCTRRRLLLQAPRLDLPPAK